MGGERDGFHGTTDLALGPDGKPTILIRDPDNGTLADTLLIVECLANCETDDAQWRYGELSSRGGNSVDNFDLEIDSRGRKHLAYSGGLPGGIPDPGIAYLSCKASCTDFASWTTARRIDSDPALQFGTGFRLNLEVDTNDALHLAFFTAQASDSEIDPEDIALIHHLSCTQRCANDGSWSVNQVIDVRSLLVDPGIYPPSPYPAICDPSGWGMYRYSIQVAGTVSVATAARLELRAPRIAFAPGFRVLPGGQLSAIADPGVTCPAASAQTASESMGADAEETASLTESSAPATTAATIPAAAPVLATDPAALPVWLHDQLHALGIDPEHLSSSLLDADEHCEICR